MRSGLRNKLKSEFIRNSAILVSGNVAGQVVALAAYPFLTRIYSNAEFGVFALFMSLSNILTTLATGKYEESIILTASSGERHRLTGFIVKLVLSVSVVIGLLLGIFRESIFSLFDMNSLLPHWYLIPFMIFWGGMYAIMSNLAVKMKQFKTLASANIAQNTSSSAFKLGLGYGSFTGAGLILSNLLAYIVAFFSFRKLWKELKFSLSTPWSEQKESGLKYRDFPQYNMTRNMVNSFSGDTPFLLLTGVFGEATLGLFSLAMTMGFRPTTLISNSLFNTLFEKTSAYKQEGKVIFPVIKKYWMQVSLFSLPVAAIIFWIAPPIFGWIFGDGWEQSGIYFRYLLPWVFMSVLSYPMVFIPALFKKQNQALWIEVFCMILRCLVISIGIYLNDFRLAIILYSLVGCLFSLICLGWYTRLIKKYDGGLKND